MSIFSGFQACNEEGKSSWSEEVTYTTLPDLPGPPLRPAHKGRIHPNSFKVRWDPPADNGGSPVNQFLLEVDDGVNGWRTFYQVRSRSNPLISPFPKTCQKCLRFLS